EEQEVRENVALVDEHLASEEIEKMVDGQENIVDDSSIPMNDESNIPGIRIEPQSDKESPEVEIAKEKEVEISKEKEVELTNVVIPVNINDKDEEITDEVYELKRREKGKIVEETRNSPIPIPIRSPRIHTNLVSLDTEKLQELTDTPHTTSSSSLPHKKIAKTNRLQSLFKTKPTRFKRYKSFFHELQGCYGYLFAHLRARFMPRKSFDTLADNLHDVMVETLPAMVDKHIKEQVVKQVPEQVQNQVPVYVTEGLILERQKAKEETKRLIAKAILQERGNIQAQISTQIENAIANVIPSQVDASVRSYMSGHILHVHPAQSQTSSVPEQQYQLYLAMKADPQLQQQDIAIWLALQMKFERNTVLQTACRTPAVRPRDQDDPHDDAHPEGENSAKRQKTSEFESLILILAMVVKTYWKLGHEYKFITEIVARRANNYLVSITEPDYKNLNKNDIEDIYLLIMNGKVPDYADTRLLWSLLVFIRKGLKSYNNDIKYGYVQKYLTKDEADYLKLFEEEIEEILKHRRQMRK
ncbi:hypothetical protein Tco_0961425, partial [Tanacetum coccineum]